MTCNATFFVVKHCLFGIFLIFALWKMGKIARHIRLVIAMLFIGISHYGGVQAENIGRQPQNNAQVSRYDGLINSIAEERNQPLSVVFDTDEGAQRYSSNRNPRLIPTHGFGPNNGSGHFSGKHQYSLKNIKFLHLCRKNCVRQTGGASPRHYYIIALRRILC
ncbi:MAG: hypothetical protein IIT64_01365 [Bacteroidaceae bacterium]|nr:hypothetical protein [Bacteroidaceae bacterium]